MARSNSNLNAGGIVVARPTDVSSDHKEENTREPSYYRRALYNVKTFIARTAPTVFVGDPWSDITGGDLILGRIPSESENEHLKIFNFAAQHSHRPFMAVFSVVEDWERRGAGLLWTTSTVSEATWGSLGIHCHMIEIPDGTAEVCLQKVVNANATMQAYLKLGGLVYVHCMQGKGRSATLVAINLATTPRSELKSEQLEGDFEKSEAYLVSKRKQVEILPKQKIMAREVINRFKSQTAHPQVNTYYDQRINTVAETIWTQEKNQENSLGADSTVKFQQGSSLKIIRDYDAPIPSALIEEQLSYQTLKYTPQDLKSKIDTYLVSPEAKQLVTGLPEYQALQTLAAPENKHPMQLIAKKLLNSILDAKDSEWYADLLHPRDVPSTPKRLLMDTPYHLGDSPESKEYKRMVKDFTQHLMLCLRRIFWCEEQTIKSAFDVSREAKLAHAADERKENSLDLNENKERECRVMKFSPLVRNLT